MQLTVIGLGYVGLPLAVSFAMSGITVFGIDINKDIVDSLNANRYSYKEPGLNSALKSVLNKTLFVSDNIVQSDTYIVTVQTPVDKNYRPDNSFVVSAMKSIASVLKDGDLIILESTVPVGSNDEFVGVVRNNSSADFKYCYSPESILPGNIFHEIRNNDKVIGGMDSEASNRAKMLYDYINSGEKLLTSIKEAEFVKIVQNAHRDVEIAFVNELSIMCEREGVDPFTVIDIARHHPRCNLLDPGSGVGGHCLAVDPYFLIERFGDDASLIKTARIVNDRKPVYVAQKAIEAIKGDRSKIIGVLGLSYKPNCEDCRESSGLSIVKYLQDNGFIVEANEYNSHEDYIYGIRNVALEKVLSTCDVLIIAQKHSRYKKIDFSHKTIIDPVNIIDKVSSRRY